MNNSVISKKESKIFITFFIIYILFVNWPGMRETSIFSLTRAIVDEGKLTIDSFYNSTSDRSFYNGHYYSDKEPGLSFLATPIYAAWKFIYYNFFPKDFIQTHHGTREYTIEMVHESVPIVYYTNPGFFILTSMIFVTIFTSSLFSSLTAVLIYKFSRFWTKKENIRLTLAVIYGIGSLAFHSSLTFMGHATGTFFIFSSFYLLYLSIRYKKNLPYFLLSGALAGFAITLDLLSLIIAELLFLYVLIQKKYKESLIFLLGLLIGVSPFLIYNFIIFGNPLDLPRNHLDKTIWSQLPGNNGVIFNLPYNFHVMLRLLFYPYRGLFIYFPVLLLFIPGLYLMWKKQRLETILIFSIFVSVLFTASMWWAWWHGASFGPRLLTIMSPFLVLPIIYVLKNNYTKPLFLTLLLISTFNNFSGITDSYEDMIKDPRNSLMLSEYQEKFNRFEVLENPLKDYYYPQFFQCGPRSKILESVIESKDPDIRSTSTTPCSKPFLSLLVCLILVIVLWFSDICKTFKFKLGIKEKIKKIKEKIHYDNRFFLLLLPFLLFVFLNFIYVSYTILFYPYDLDVTESYIIVPTMRMLNGGPLYNDIHTPLHFSVVKYPPLFYMLNYFTMLVFGENLFSARILVLSATLLVGIFVFLIVRKITKDWKLSLFSALLFFSSYVTFQMATQVRVDMLALLFSTIGIYFFLDYKKGKNMLLSILFFVLSVFTNQSFVAAPISAFLYLLLNDKKNVVKFLILFLIPSTILGLLINVLTDGQFFLHVVYYTKGLIDISLMTIFLRLRESILFLIIGLFYLTKKRKDILFFWFIISLVVLLIKLSREGSWINYLLEMTTIVPIITALILKQTRDKLDYYFIIALVVLQLVIFISYDGRILFYMFSPKSFTPLVNWEADRKIHSYIENTKGNVFCEHAGYLIASGKQPTPEIWSTYELQTTGVISADNIFNYFKSQNYTTVIYLKRLPYLTNFFNYVKKNYVLVEEIPWIDQGFNEDIWHVYIKK